MASVSLAQDVPRVQESVSVGYVMIPFTVLGDQGAPITDLHRNEVKLLIDGKRVPSDMFEKSQNAPVSFTILGQNPTRAIILLSDGIDNASKLTRDDLAKLLQGVAVPIYPLGIRDPREQAGHSKEELSDLDILDAVANLTGGKLHLGNEPQQIALAIASIEKDLRAQYLIGFAPTGQGGIKYRRISLKLAGRVHGVRVRAGYFGTEPPLVVLNGERKKS